MIAQNHTNSKNFNVLISSVGRRGQLIECIRQSLFKLGLPGSIIGADCSRKAAAAHLVDRFFQVPRCGADDFPSEMLRICKDNDVTLLIPTIDTELSVYAKYREDFATQGTIVCVSSPETIEISADKSLTNCWLVENGFPTVRQGRPEQVLNQPSDWRFPLIAKPHRGSASVGVRIVNSSDSLRSFSSERSDIVVEEIAVGHEHTINVFVDRQSQCISAVPHIRLEVRAGEVSKGMTVKHAGIIELASRVSERLPGAYGPLNIQGFLSPQGEFRITEINARFGGGYPLAHKAGVDFPRWLVEESLGLPSSAKFNGWQDGLTMLRYDTAVFLSGEELENYQQ